MTAEQRAFRKGAEAMRAACLKICDEVIEQAHRNQWTPGRIMTGKGAAITIENQIYEISAADPKGPRNV